MTLIEIIVECVLEPLLDMLSRRHTSGKWHLSYLLLPAFAVFVGVFWLGKTWDSALLMVIGALGAVIFGLLNLLLFLPRVLGEKEDFDFYLERRKREAESSEKESDSGKTL